MARLKTLPEERQAEIIELMRDRSLNETVKELAKDGFKTSRTALGEFWSWWHLRQRFNQVGAFSEQMVEMLKEEAPRISDETLERYGQRLFKARAIEMEQADPEAAALIWHRMQKLRLQGEIVQLERQKFQRETCRLFLKWAEDERAKQIANRGGMEQGEKIQALGHLMFGEDWNAAETKDPKST